MPYPWKSFRDWIADEEALGEVVRIKAPIKAGDPNSIVDAVPAEQRQRQMEVINCPGANGKAMETELRAVSRYLHSLPKNPIGVIENPINNRPDVPVVINPWSTRERVLRMAGCKSKDELLTKIQGLKQNLLEPKVIDKKDAPCKEVIITEDEVDIYKHLPRNWVEFETVPWSPCGGGEFIVFDPKTATHDLGIWRGGFFEWDDGDPDKPLSEERRKKHMCVAMIYDGPIASDGGTYYRENYRKFNKPMPAAYAMCTDPSMALTAAVRSGLVWPQDNADEFAVAGAIRGEAVELVDSETIPGLKVPAHAEFIIEGEFLPEDYFVPKYAEGVYQGHLLGNHEMPVFRIKAITHRKNPMWMTTWSGSGMNHKGPHSDFADLLFETEALAYLRKNDYKVKDVVSYDLETIVVQTEIDGMQKPPHYGKQVLSAIYACPHGYLGNGSKYYIVVGPDIDPYNLRDVLWALGTRAQPVSDSYVIKDGLCAWGDPSGLPGPLGWRAYGQQVFIDALIKVPERRTEWEPRTEPREWEEEAIKRIRRKLEDYRG